MSEIIQDQQIQKQFDNNMDIIKEQQSDNKSINDTEIDQQQEIQQQPVIELQHINNQQQIQNFNQINNTLIQNQFNNNDNNNIDTNMENNKEINNTISIDSDKQIKNIDNSNNIINDDDKQQQEQQEEKEKQIGEKQSVIFKSAIVLDQNEKSSVMKIEESEFLVENKKLQEMEEVSFFEKLQNTKKIQKTPQQKISEQNNNQVQINNIETIKIEDFEDNLHIWDFENKFQNNNNNNNNNTNNNENIIKIDIQKKNLDTLLNMQQQLEKYNMNNMSNFLSEFSKKMEFLQNSLILGHEKLLSDLESSSIKNQLLQTKLDHITHINTQQQQFQEQQSSMQITKQIEKTQENKQKKQKCKKCQISKFQVLKLTTEIKNLQLQKQQILQQQQQKQCQLVNISTQTDILEKMEKNQYISPCKITEEIQQKQQISQKKDKLLNSNTSKQSMSEEKVQDFQQETQKLNTPQKLKFPKNNSSTNNDNQQQINQKNVLDFKQFQDQIKDLINNNVNNQDSEKSQNLDSNSTFKNLTNSQQQQLQFIDNCWVNDDNKSQNQLEQSFSIEKSDSNNNIQDNSSNKQQQQISINDFNEKNQKNINKNYNIVEEYNIIYKEILQNRKDQTSFDMFTYMAQQLENYQKTDETIYAFILKELGTILKADQQDQIQAQQILLNSQQIMEKIENKNDLELQVLSEIYANLSDIEYEQFNIEEAINLNQQAMQLILEQKEQNQQNLANIYLQIAQQYFTCQDYDNSLFYFRECSQKKGSFIIDDQQDYAQNCEDVSDCLMGIGLIYQKRNMNEQAIVTFLQCLKIRRKLPFGQNDVKISDTLYHLGEIYIWRQDFREALKSFNECYKLRQPLYEQNDPLIIDVLKQIQDLEIQMKHTGIMPYQQQYSGGSNQYSGGHRSYNDYRPRKRFTGGNKYQNQLQQQQEAQQSNLLYNNQFNLLSENFTKELQKIQELENQHKLMLQKKQNQQQQQQQQITMSSSSNQSNISSSHYSSINVSSIKKSLKYPQGQKEKIIKQKVVTTTHQIKNNKKDKENLSDLIQK